MAAASRHPRSVALGRRAASRAVRRAGYTLLELCAVMALIVILASIAIPSYSGLMAGARVDAAGDMVLARMADARSMAMEQGTPFRFGFIPGTGRYQIAADDSPLWQNAGSQGTTIDAKDHVAGELPQDVIFTTDVGALANSGGGSGGGGGWHMGGVFLPDGMARGGFNPDGTTIDDVTFYFGMPGRAPQGVRVRGLTGTVRLFDPADAEANQP